MRFLADIEALIKIFKVNMRRLVLLLSIGCISRLIVLDALSSATRVESGRCFLAVWPLGETPRIRHDVDTEYLVRLAVTNSNASACRAVLLGEPVRCF